MKLNNIIYLIGQIAPKNEESFAWRIRVKNWFNINDTKNNFYLINPCDNDFNQGTKKNLTRNELYKVDGLNLIVPKDRRYVKMANIIFANLNMYDQDIALVGTLFELAWARDGAETAIIGIADKNKADPNIVNHPFIQEAITEWVTDEIKACELAYYFFKVEL